MDRLVEQSTATPERRRIVAAWELLERAEALLPRDHPAAWRLAQALAALEAEWRGHRTTADAVGAADTATPTQVGGRPDGAAVRQACTSPRALPQPVILGRGGTAGAAPQFGRE